jgi:hypothetical protein
VRRQKKTNSEFRRAPNCERRTANRGCEGRHLQVKPAIRSRPGGRPLRRRREMVSTMVGDGCEGWNMEKSEVRTQKSELRSQNSELRSQNSEVRTQKSAEPRTANAKLQTANPGPQPPSLCRSSRKRDHSRLKTKPLTPDLSWTTIF